MIASRIRHIRQQLGWSRTHAAMLLRVGTERLASYETGRVPVPERLLFWFSELYQVEVDWIKNGGAPFNHITVIKDLPVPSVVKKKK